MIRVPDPDPPGSVSFVLPGSWYEYPDPPFTMTTQEKLLCLFLFEGTVHSYIYTILQKVISIPDADPRGPKRWDLGSGSACF